MEKNNFNKAYIYIIAIFAIGIAVSNIISFFHGVGFALIGASLLLILAITNILRDESIKKRFGDIFVLIAIELIMLIILFFAYDFNLNGITNNFPLVMRNICAIYSLIATGYVIFRYVSEIKGKKYNFVEYMLGNYTPDPTAKKKSKAASKKNKELENGTLAPKPSSLENNVTAQEEGSQPSQEETKDDEIIIEEDGDIKDTAQDVEEVKSEEEKTEESKPTTTNRTNFW
ncbi:MAG: hypothetical protein IJ371_00810 [Clostridia bacterium]|nr:hypothetical protein [Clostridia bacterium]